MKKLFFLMLAALSISLCTYAQLKEVRGVLTKESYYNEGRSECRGFTFTNENNYSVWIEAELWYAAYNYDNRDSNRITNTKSFTLKPGETYLWRTDHRNYHDADRYYVKYRAYIAE